MIETSQAIIQHLRGEYVSPTFRRSSIFPANFLSSYNDSSSPSSSTEALFGSTATATVTQSHVESRLVKEIIDAPIGETCRIDRTMKFLIVGNPKCGKSSIIKRYIHNTFQSNYKSTVGADFIRKDLLVRFDDDSLQTVRLQLWDIAGQDRFHKLTRLYFRDACGVVIVCDISRERTVEAIKEWKAEIDSWVDLTDTRMLPIVLFANKTDLLTSVSEAFQAGAAVERVCTELGFTNWWSTSAFSGSGVSDGFKALVRQVIEVIQLIYCNISLLNRISIFIDSLSLKVVQCSHNQVTQKT